MRRLVVLLHHTFLLAVAGAGAAAGQHAEGMVTDEEQTQCAFCHGSHGGGPGAYNLKVDLLKVWIRPDMAGEPGTVSYSCLRCHATESTRERQPEFGRRLAIPEQARSYLGFDLSADHPLGRLSEEQLDRQRAAGMAGRDGWAGEDPEDMVECTDCHDPHDRSGPGVTPEEEAAVCTACHDPTAFQASHEQVPCTSCHRIHSSDLGPLLTGASPGMVCRSCHTDGRPVEGITSRRSVVPVAPTTHVDAPAVAQRDCTTCHAVHVAQP